MTDAGVGNSSLKPLVRISHDAGFTENPMERENVESSVSIKLLPNFSRSNFQVHADSVKGLWEVMDGLKIQVASCKDSRLNQNIPVDESAHYRGDLS